jgi:excinuclease ABC subunit A
MFDPGQQAGIDAELSRPLRLDESGVDARMPWQVDGRKWHLETHLDHHGKRAAWDPRVLAWIVETTEKIEGLAAANWNSPSTVEITAAASAPTWFLHARTRGSTQLDVSLRVPANTFSTAELLKKLAIKPLDQRDDLPIYSSLERVAVRNAGNGWSDVRIQLHDEKDLSRSAFGEFLRTAAAAYLNGIASASADPRTAAPWKSDPKQWHLSQRSIHHRHKHVHWKPALLPALIGQFTKLAPGLRVDWTRKVLIGLVLHDEMVATIVSNQPNGLRLHLRVPRASVTPAQIDRLGLEPSLRSLGAYDEVICWVRSLESLDRSQLRHVTEQMAARVTAAREKSA